MNIPILPWMRQPLLVVHHDTGFILQKFTFQKEHNLTSMWIDYSQPFESTVNRFKISTEAKACNSDPLGVDI